MTLRRLAMPLLGLLAIGAAPLAAQAGKGPAAKPPVPLDTSLTVLPAGFTGSNYDALVKHLQKPTPAAGFYAIRLGGPDGLCEEHEVRPAYDAEKGRLAVMFDGAHSSSTPGIELLCVRKIVGDLTVTAPTGEKFRAARIVERGNFVVPMESELRWQSHFEMYADMPQAEAEGLIRKMAYYLVVEPALTREPAPVVVDSTREAATPDRPDDTTIVRTQIYGTSIWLYGVDPATRKVVVKGQLLPGSCP